MRSSVVRALLAPLRLAEAKAEAEAAGQAEAEAEAETSEAKAAAAREESKQLFPIWTKLALFLVQCALRARDTRTRQRRRWPLCFGLFELVRNHRHTHTHINPTILLIRLHFLRVLAPSNSRRPTKALFSWALTR